MLAVLDFDGVNVSQALGGDILDDLGIRPNGYN